VATGTGLDHHAWTGGARKAIATLVAVSTPQRPRRKGARFARFKKTGTTNVDVWVAVGQVAYTEQISEQSVTAPTAARGERRTNPVRQRTSGP